MFELELKEQKINGFTIPAKQVKSLRGKELAQQLGLHNRQIALAKKGKNPHSVRGTARSI